MYGTRRIRVELDGDVAELHRYFAELRGLSPGKAIRGILAKYAKTAEEEHPALRAHMLAWRTAKSAESMDSVDLDAILY